jgi:phosphoglycerate kinase
VVANVFLLADDCPIGAPSTQLIGQLGYMDEVGKARRLLEHHRDRILMPGYVAVRENGSRRDYPVDRIPDDRPVLDLGIDAVVTLAGEIRSSGTVVFNGPAGVFEEELFATGTFELLRAASMAEFSVVGGGHTAAVIEKLGLEKSFTHISTGGGACIEFLTGKKLPAIAALEESRKLFG